MGYTLLAPVATRPTTATPQERWDQTLARCYDRHGPAVFGLAARITNDADVAARLTAEVFAGLSEVTDEDTLAECVVTDVHRRAVSWVRSAAQPPHPGVTERQLEALPPPERDVIAAAYFDGLTYAEIGRRLDLRLEQVAALMRSGLRRLAATTPA